jgi:antitoxin (DNA-binding transcriptional repressor) of toxin-antitoxin stability system
MKTASVRELRNHYSTVMKWIEAGEEVKISKRGKVIARLVPDRPEPPRKVDWSTSAAVTRDKSKWPMITDQQRAELFDDIKGPW